MLASAPSLQLTVHQARQDDNNSSFATSSRIENLLPPPRVHEPTCKRQTFSQMQLPTSPPGRAPHIERKREGEYKKERLSRRLYLQPQPPDLHLLPQSHSPTNNTGRREMGSRPRSSDFKAPCRPLPPFCYKKTSIQK